MRITELELQTEDIEWYGVDEDGRIAQFFSGGSKAVPEFICQSRENLTVIGKFFANFEKMISEQVLLNEDLDYPRKEFLKECKEISQKGIYCFDIDSLAKGKEYVFVCKPACPLCVTDLPLHIQDILRCYQISDTDFRKDRVVIIKESQFDSEHIIMQKVDSDFIKKPELQELKNCKNEKQLLRLAEQMGDRIRYKAYTQAEAVFVANQLMKQNLLSFQYETREQILYVLSDAVTGYQLYDKVNLENILNIKDSLEEDLKEYVEEMISDTKVVKE